jgi:zinc protease
VPANKLQTMLWAEADRMRGLDVTQANLDNQRSVVKNEVRVNVRNQPYGGFPWLDLPQLANQNWHNAHNFYGDMKDLDAATLQDVQAFFKQYYAPNNAALVVVGDIDTDTAMAWVRQYFGGIPRGPALQPTDVSEPPQTAEKRITKTDSLATRPALAVGYHMPARNTPEYYAMGLIDQILLQGDDSWLHQALVQEHGFAGSVNGGINLLGDMFDYDGPMLWTFYMFHDAASPGDSILAVVDSVMDRIRTQPVDSATLARALVKERSFLYDMIEQNRDDLLASFSLFDRDPARINQLDEDFAEVTPALIQKTAEQFLRATNRTVLMVQPAAKNAAFTGAAGGRVRGKGTGR